VKSARIFSALMAVMRAIGEAVGRPVLLACFLLVPVHRTKMRGGVILYPICVRRLLLALQMVWTWKDGSAWIGGGIIKMFAFVSTVQTNSQWAKHLAISATVS